MGTVLHKYMPDYPGQVKVRLLPGASTSQIQASILKVQKITIVKSVLWTYDFQY